MSRIDKAKSPVARRLREARVRKGLSQKALGILAGIDEFSASPRINQYEQDKHVPDYSTSRRLAEALEVPVPYLYAEGDELAELILSYAQVGVRKRAQVRRLLSGQ